MRFFNAVVDFSSIWSIFDTLYENVPKNQLSQLLRQQYKKGDCSIIIEQQTRKAKVLNNLCFFSNFLTAGAVQQTPKVVNRLI